MRKIPVIWHSQDNGRGHYNCTAQVNDMFDLYDCIHLAGLPNLPFRHLWSSFEGAVFIVHGGRQLGSIDRLNKDIEDLKWVVLICLGDEECSFPVEQIDHPNRKIWVQEPMPGRHDFADRFILDGYTPTTRQNVVRCDKDLDWVFAGQVTHERRRACVRALQSIDWGGVIIESKGYCQGVSPKEYYSLLSRARIVPCPSGPFSPDAARPWEALECGAIPILDDLSPTRHEPGFWKLVLGDHPLPVINDWSTLPEKIKEVKDNYQSIMSVSLFWWKCYCEDFNTWLGQDIEELCKKM